MWHAWGQAGTYHCPRGAQAAPPPDYRRRESGARPPAPSAPLTLAYAGSLARAPWALPLLQGVAAVTARVSRLEGMEGHALTADARLEKYFPGQRFDLGEHVKV